MTLHHGDCLDVMAAMEPESVDAIVTDPPYGLEFMGMAWDHGVMGRPFAEAMLRVAKPSAYLLAFGGTRTVHRMTVALEDAGWVIRDMLVWGYASGFPKSKASLKPAWEPIVMARKPGPLRMLAIDECRIPTTDSYAYPNGPQGTHWAVGKAPDGLRNEAVESDPAGRWPANIVLSDELFEPGVPGVVIAGSLTGTMTAWSSSPDSEHNPTGSPASNAVRRSSRTGRVGSSRGSVVDPAATPLDVWGTSTDIPKPDTGCSDGTTTGSGTTSGSTATSGSRPTDPSRPDTLSTTATATGSTTPSTTSNSSPEPSTSASTSQRTPRSFDSDVTPRPEASDHLSDDSANWRRNSPTAATRAGEASAGRRYDERGVADFAPLPGERRDDDGAPGYSRFFLIPKADRADREPVLGGQVEVSDHRTLAGGVSVADGRTAVRGRPGPRENSHPTVKPTDLMRHLVRLVTPTGGVVLDPFLGSGTTALAAEMEGFAWIGIEREAEYVAIAEARLNGTQRGLGLTG